MLLDGGQSGPFTTSQLKAMWTAGKLTSETLYWSEGLADWFPLGVALEEAIEEEKACAERTRQPVQESNSFERTLNHGDIICPNPQCRYCGPPKKVARGSFLVGLFLCLFFLLPGLIYLAVMSGYNYVCPQCGMHIRTGPHT